MFIIGYFTVKFQFWIFYQFCVSLFLDWKFYSKGPSDLPWTLWSWGPFYYPPPIETSICSAEVKIWFQLKKIRFQIFVHQYWNFCDIFYKVKAGQKRNYLFVFNRNTPFQRLDVGDNIFGMNLSIIIIITIVQGWLKSGVGSERNLWHFFRLIARILTFRDKKYRMLTFRDKKYRILTFRDKTESYLTVLQQNNAEAC